MQEDWGPTCIVICQVQAPLMYKENPNLLGDTQVYLAVSVHAPVTMHCHLVNPTVR